MAGNSIFPGLVALLLSSFLAACVSLPDRVPFTAQDQASADVPGFANIRHWADAPLAEWQSWHDERSAELDRQQIDEPTTLLAISSGSDKGAFSAGYLAGWTNRGDRPSFSVVTGVSTGALIAPFAFLGSAYDPFLHYLYTGIDAGDVYSRRPLGVLIGAPSLTDTRPLKRLIERHVTGELLDRIAAEHANGRRLFIMTTNLDAQRGVVWNMGAIASSPSPRRVRLFRDILLASASIPGVFPPVLIDVESGTARFKEMHVDGGATTSLFVLPPALLWGDGSGKLEAPRGSSMTMLYNGALEPKFEMVKPRAFAIMARALGAVVSEADRQNILAYRRFAENHGIGLNIVTIGEDFTAEGKGLFDPEYMRRLYNHGRSQALAAPAND